MTEWRQAILSYISGLTVRGRTGTCITLRRPGQRGPMARFGTGRGLRVSRDSGLYRQRVARYLPCTVPEFASSMILFTTNQMPCITAAFSQKRGTVRAKGVCRLAKRCPRVYRLVRLWRECRSQVITLACTGPGTGTGTWTWPGI